MVCSEKSRGERTQPQGDLMLVVWDLETCFPRFMCCFSSDRKSVMHLQLESGTWNWDRLVL